MLCSFSFAAAYSALADTEINGVEFSYVYDGSALPLSTDWRMPLGNGSASSDGNTFTITTTASENRYYLMTADDESSSWDATVSDGSTIEFCSRIISEHSSSTAGSVTLTVSNGSRNFSFSLWKDKVGINGDPATFQTVDTTQENVFRLLLSGTGATATMSVYLNGQTTPIISNYTSLSANANNRIYFGDPSGAFGGASQWRYIAFTNEGAYAPAPAYEEVVIGYWEIPDRVLVAVLIDEQYYLVQRNTDGSYFVPRGRNMLFSSGVTITNTGFPLNQIVSDETGIGGLMPPENFPATAFAALGFVYDIGSGEWHPVEENPDEELAIQKVDLTVAAETQNDTLNLNEFRATYDYSKFIANFGFGSPYYRGEANASIEPIAAGWSHVNSAQTYPESILPGQNVASFQFFHYYEGGNLFTSARAILSEYPGAQAVLDQNWDVAASDDAMLEALSHHMVGFWMVADAAAENSYRWGSYSMVDEEEISSYSKLVFALKLLAHTSNRQPDKILVYYGYPVLSLFWGGSHWQNRASETDLNNWKNEPLFFVPEIRNSRLYFDGNSGYVKSPLPISETLYQKDGNGNYLLINGKRQFRTDVFSETLFGIQNTWLDVPNDLLPNDQRSGQPYTHDVKWAVTNPYYMLTKWQLVQIANMNMNGHGYDITRYRDLPNKPIAIQSLLTEPWTYGGNQRYRRWISEEQIKFILMAPLMMGFAGVELWEGGWLAERFYNPDYPGRSWGANLPLVYKGTPQYPHWSYEGSPQFTVPGFDENTPMSENFSRFKWATKAVSEMRKVYSYYTKDETLRFLHFTRHGTAVADREMILMGLYQGTNMHILAWYPYHDPEDTTEVTITVNGETYPLTVEGRKVGLYHLTISGNPAPHEITAEYMTIDGTPTMVTGDLEQHLPSQP